MVRVTGLDAESTYSTPIQIYSVESKDPRIDTKILNNVIQPWKKDGVTAVVTFDAGLTGTPKK